MLDTDYHIITIHATEDRGITSCDRDTAMARNADGFGVYFSINSIRPGVTTKPKRDDVVAIRYAHVDIDPPPNGPWDKDAVFADVMSQNPSKVIDSGNGIQAMWALVPGCTIDQVEQINRGLIQRFNADKGTWNADRVFRMPDTINWPNHKKQALGRTPALATLLYESEAVFEAKVLAEVWPYTPPPTKIGEAEIEPVEWQSIDLPEGVSTELYDLVHNPRGSDRSSDVMKAVVLMGRENFTDAQIMGILLNDKLAISAHCLDQADPERQARRKAVHARPFRPPSPEMMFGDDTDMELPPEVRTEPAVVSRSRLGGYSPRDGRDLHQDEQMDHFQGCVYITSLDKIFVPGGELLNRSRFEAVYGGYAFVTDALGQSKPGKSAWEAFLNNQRYAPPTANYLCFRPEEPVGAIIEDGTRTAYNTYVPIETPRSDGDVTPFLDHVARLFPVERDRRILLTYMASLVQNPGVKFQWAPVIVGVQGNGKTLLISVIVYCLGEQYCYLPNTAKMTRNGINFNGWIQGKLFLGMEEVYSANRRDFLEEFKTYVTNLRLPIEGKGQDEYMGDNRANMMFLTNHEDGIPFDPDERRYAAMFTAQREKEDKARDGMGGEYFPRLWRWLRSGGFAAINGYLRSYECEAEFDPAQQAVDAPYTSSTERAIRAGRGSIEQEVLAAIDEDRPGFCGGWVSSKAMETLFKERNIKLAPNKRPAMLAKLGFGPHPFLVDGRTPGVVMPDGVRCRLYIKDGHISRASTDPCEAYTKAQLRGQTEIAEAKLGA